MSSLSFSFIAFIVLGMLPNANNTDYVPANGKPSIIPMFREIRHNFMVGYYSSQENIDTDDGSSFYHTHSNFFVYAADGLKSDFGGQWNHHYNNGALGGGTIFEHSI